MRTLFAVGLAVLVATFVVGCGPKIKDLEKGETAKAIEVRDGDTFAMEGGLVVHLAGVEAPRGDQPRAREARAALERLVAHRTVQLAYGGQKRARDAAVAQVFAKTEGGRWVWVQQALLLSGDARVHTRKDNIGRLGEMRAAETAARTAKRGVWSDPFFAVHRAEDVARGDEETAALPACVAERAAFEAAKAAPKAEKAQKADDANADQPRRSRRARDFEIVEGQITSVAERERAVFLNFGDDITRDFGVMVPKDALDGWPGGLPALTALQGKSVRVRGDVPRCGKPLMRVDHAQQVEMIGGR